MDLVKFQKFRDDEIMCEFDCYWTEEACEKVFALRTFSVNSTEMLVQRGDDALDACSVSSYAEVKEKENPVTIRFDGTYGNEDTTLLIDFNAKFLAVRSTRESICYDLAREVLGDD